MADEAKETDAKPEEPKAMRQDASTGQMVEGKHAETKKGDPKKPTMQVKVWAPFEIYFEGEAYSVTAENESGIFDILPHHRNFLCMLVPCDMLIRTPYDDQTIKISRALMHVKAEKVSVYLDV